MSREGTGAGSPAASGRWEQLFGDLEAQLAAGRADEARWDVADLTRAERARVPLGDRLRAAVGTRLRVVTGPGESLEGVVAEAAAQWVLLDLGGGRRALVPTAAVLTVDGLGTHAAPPAGRVESGLGLGHVLRALARDRAVVTVRTGAGTLTGRLDRVGADHLDLVLDVPARRAVSVPFGALRAVESR
ncbi:hypothetical protein [Cellulomonas wangsupingiae]|uniref:Uncharacterized protein n=1 Tax=Cellulomonas wangsupingiae TaxID=2968085 RepID=A0ABY5K3Z5_9CELL|nr:hypothetical protein [Cellulomonas wangsupingiae]MCC2335640.1 hypothetical protein [Cellulomonas wangsupingiae]MCM0640271.1 hypothetical protein [Cellulomonas wangsupingiae]UUI63877.1 hypothetical protein NP075_12120 [Cellulomonas wangsupingiae]